MFENIIRNLLFFYLLFDFLFNFLLSLFHDWWIPAFQSMSATFNFKGSNNGFVFLNARIADVWRLLCFQSLLFLLLFFLPIASLLFLAILKNKCGTLSWLNFLWWNRNYRWSRRFLLLFYLLFHDLLQCRVYTEYFLLFRRLNCISCLLLLPSFLIFSPLLFFLFVFPLL